MAAEITVMLEKITRGIEQFHDILLRVIWIGGLDVVEHPLHADFAAVLLVNFPRSTGEGVDCNRISILKE